MLESIQNLDNALASAMVTGLMALAATLGTMLNAALTRKQRRKKDLKALVVKIRNLETYLEIPTSEITNLDEAFCAIRRIEGFIYRRDADELSG